MHWASVGMTWNFPPGPCPAAVEAKAQQILPTNRQVPNDRHRHISSAGRPQPTIGGVGDSKLTLRRVGRGLARGWAVVFGAFWLSVMWAYMAPMRLLPASANEHLVRYSCWLNTYKIPRSTCDREIQRAAVGHVPPNGWWRLAASVVTLIFAVWLALREFQRRER